MYNQIAANKRQSFFLMIIFAAVVIGLAYFFSWYLQTGYSLVAFAVIFSLISSVISFYASDKIALSIAGAKEIQQQDNPYVYRLVENLAITAGIPRPRIFIIPDEALNAFATGRDPQHASIALTTGIIARLENEELEGVIAHELSHVKNFDTRLMTVAIICVGIVTLLANMMTRNMMWGGRRRSNDNNSGGVLIIIGVVLGILAPIFAKLLQLAVSRQREYLADASGALLTRYPEGLASALEKISQSVPLQHINQATAHLYISEPSGDPLTSEMRGEKTGGFKSWFSTHPPIADRIKKLRSMS
jgi:heat shock protein HtpX